MVDIGSGRVVVPASHLTSFQLVQVLKFFFSMEIKNIVGC